MKRVLFTIVVAVLCLTTVPAASAQTPPFVQACIDSCAKGTVVAPGVPSTCDGAPIAYGTFKAKGADRAYTFFVYKNSDTYVQVLVDSTVPSSLRQNLQATPSGNGETGHWETKVLPSGYTWVGTSGYDVLCKDKIKTNLKVMKKIIEAFKDADVPITTIEYFD